MSYGDQMFRGTRRLVGVAGVLILSSGLSACAAPSSPTPTALATRSETSIFTSRAQAGAAFRSLYESYLTSLNAVSVDGGQKPERLKKFLVPSQYPEVLSSTRRFVEGDLHLKGEARLSAFKLQSIDLKTGVGSAYVCVDVSQTHILDSRGDDVTPKGRADKQPLVINFVNGPLITTSKVWSGDDVC